MTRDKFLNTTTYGKAFKQARESIACVDDAGIRRDLYETWELRVDYEVENWERDKRRVT